jgi:hypothetical protein
MDATSCSGPLNGTHGSDVAHPADDFNSQPAPAPMSGNPTHTSARSTGAGATTVVPPADVAAGSIRRNPSPCIRAYEAEVVVARPR